VRVSRSSHHHTAAIYVGLTAGRRERRWLKGTEYVQCGNEMLKMPCAQPGVGGLAPLLELEPWQVVTSAQGGRPDRADGSCTAESGEADGAPQRVQGEGGGVSAVGQAGPFKGD